MKAPFLVAEQLRVDQLVGDRAAIDADERPLGTRRAVVDCAGDQLLARARLAEDEHGHVGAGDQLDALHDGLQPRLGADDHVAELVASQAVQQRAFLGFRRLAQGGHFAEAMMVAQGDGEGLQEDLDEFGMARLEALPVGAANTSAAQRPSASVKRTGQHVRSRRPAAAARPTRRRGHGCHG